MPKITTADIKNGTTILIDGNIYNIIEFLHVKPGKGGAFVRTKLKGVVTGKVLDKTFRSGETLETVRVERHPYQYLYRDDDMFHFMHQETYEQLMIPAEKINGAEFMKEGSIITVVINTDDNNNVLFTEIPDHVELEITKTDPGIRGDTAQGGSKPATLETGGVINVPLFLNEGDVVKVDTRTSSYIERVKTS
ncbi:MAG TPA: elongation factor P [Balneolales bacterium]|nr:elongation factor P [Balneolales bacterium]